MIPKIEEIEKELTEMQESKDRLMQISREMIRLSGKAVTMMHAGNMKGAEANLKRISGMAKELKTFDPRFDYNAQQAHQEYVEALALYQMLKHGRIPSRKDADVDSIAYLLGLLDVMGELKREVFESLRKDDVKSAERYYGFMVEIHDSLLPMRFSSSMMPDFRKKQDVGRIQLESVSSELLSFRKKSG